MTMLRRLIKRPGDLLAAASRHDVRWIGFADRDTAAKIIELNLPSYAPRSITPALPQGCTPQSRVTKAHGAAIRVGHAGKDLLVLIADISSVLRLNAVGSNTRQLRPCPGACSELTTRFHSFDRMTRSLSDHTNRSANAIGYRRPSHMVTENTVLSAPHAAQSGA